MTSFILSGGTLADGTGEALRVADVLVTDGRIADVGDLSHDATTARIDCRGAIVAPGFIDAHSHSDLQVIESRREKLLQGVTSEVVGNCGFSAYPQGEHAKELRAFANGIFCGGHTWGWSDAAAYLAQTKKSAGVANVFSLVGHGSLRIAAAGNRMDALPEPMLSTMESALRDALQAGAVGFSTGLMYAPGSSAPASELERLCRVVAEEDRIYTTQISHLQAVGRANRDLNARALGLIEEASARGVDVAFDCYPYIAGTTVMTQLLPQWALDGGTDALLARLASKVDRAAMEAEMKLTMANSWDELLMSAVGSAANARLVGRSLEELGRMWSARPIDALFDLLLEEKAQVNVLEFNQSEENLRTNLSHPLSIIISDGFYVKGRPHPRLHGTFPELLGNLCRDRGWMPIETAVRKITGFPADRFLLKDRGYLRAGSVADITVFDPATIRSQATYDDPERAPEGVLHVFKEGRSLLGVFPAQ
jgi:N-acyl-D-amino-acid deacylase